jgi:hypothetical protein
MQKLSLLLLPVLTLALMGCGQLISAKNPYTMKNSNGVIAGCAALQVQNASGVEANILSGLSACGTTSANSVVIKYNLLVSNYKLCVFPTTGAVISSSQGQCFYPSGFVGEQTLSFSAAFTGVDVVEERNVPSFQTTSFGGISAPYASATFR